MTFLTRHTWHIHKYGRTNRWNQYLHVIRYIQCSLFLFSLGGGCFCHSREFFIHIEILHFKTYILGTQVEIPFRSTSTVFQVISEGSCYSHLLSMWPHILKSSVQSRPGFKHPTCRVGGERSSQLRHRSPDPGLNIK